MFSYLDCGFAYRALRVFVKIAVTVLSLVDFALEAHVIVEEFFDRSKKRLADLRLAV
jgi:hypothetical protein